MSVVNTLKDLDYIRMLFFHLNNGKEDIKYNHNMKEITFSGHYSNNTMPYIVNYTNSWIYYEYSRWIYENPGVSFWLNLNVKSKYEPSNSGSGRKLNLTKIFFKNDGTDENFYKKFDDTMKFLSEYSNVIFDYFKHGEEIDFFYLF